MTTADTRSSQTFFMRVTFVYKTLCPQSPDTRVIDSVFNRMIGQSTLLVAAAFCVLATALPGHLHGGAGLGAGHLGGSGGGVGHLGGSGVGVGHLGGSGGGFGHLGGSGVGVGHLGGAGVGVGHLGGSGAGIGHLGGAGVGVGHLGGSSVGVGHLGGVGAGSGLLGGVGVGGANYNPSHYPDIVPGYQFQQSYPGKGFGGCANWCRSSVQRNYYCCTRTSYAG